MSARWVIQSLRTPVVSLRLLVLLTIALLAAGLLVHNETYRGFLGGMALGLLVGVACILFSVREITLKEDHSGSNLESLKLS